MIFDSLGDTFMTFALSNAYQKWTESKQNQAWFAAKLLVISLPSFRNWGSFLQKALNPFWEIVQETHLCAFKKNDFARKRISQAPINHIRDVFETFWAGEWINLPRKNAFLQ